MTRRKWILVLTLSGYAALLVMTARFELARYAEQEADLARRAREWAPRVGSRNAYKLRTEGEAIVAALESYRETSGRFPDALNELQPSNPDWSDWRYEVTAEGEAHLWIGEYELHGFCTDWSSTYGWHVDT